MKRNLKVLKRGAAVAFGVAFLMALVIFFGYGRQYISVQNARTIFMISGAIALLLNLLSFQATKQNILFSLLYWAGSLVLFAGLTFFLMRWPYARPIIFVGMGITGISFFFSTPEPKKEDNDELLDNL